MKSTRTAAGFIAGLILMALILPGCSPELGVELVLSKDTLDFGYDRSEDGLKVHVTESGTRIEPLQVSADQAWILPQNCLDFKDGCISSGPYHDLDIRVRIDRDKLAMGLNTGSIRLTANPASPKVVQVVAEEIAQADFYVRQNKVTLGKAVEFVDLSQAAPEAGRLTSWNWDFGDGNGSSAINPVHVYSRPGVYDVRLTIKTSNGVERTVLHRAIVQVESPSAAVDFDVSNKTPDLGEAIVFTDHSTVQNVAVTGRKWIFGDGTESPGFVKDKSVSHSYAKTGVYSVTLQLKTSQGLLEAVKENYIIVRSGAAPVADFGFESNNGLLYVQEDIRFFDRSHPGTGTITDRSWSFGDGAISNAAAPVHRYNGSGSFTVSLSVQTEKGFSTKEKTLNVIYRTPTANFTVKPSRQKVDLPVSFIDTSTPGHGGNVAWLWDFGDGNTSTKQHPTHIYTAKGVYTITLTVTGGDPAGTTDSITKEKLVIILDTVGDGDDDDDDDDKSNGLDDLRAFIEYNDGAYNYSTPKSEPLTVDGQVAGTVYLVDKMTSQRWNPDGSVHPDYVEWFHPMTIFEPSVKKSNTAMLFIDGGSRTSPPKLEPAFARIAVLAGTTIVHIRNIPCQPIYFLDEVIPAGRQDNYSGAEIMLRRRSEDDIIAYSYDKYMKSYKENNGDANFHWPTLFPMVKSAVKGMDTAETILSQAGVKLDGFVVAGASKRGWTTWLTGAGDSRVKAIAPIVINVLNMADHLAHHRASYGYWGPAIYPYAQESVFDKLLPNAKDGSIVPEALALLDRVDPYEFALKGCYPMPKFMMNGTGDQFFVPDTTQYYFDDLEDDKHLCYIPNAGHDLGGIEGADVSDPEHPLGKFFSWYLAVSQNVALPQFTQSFENDGSILVQVDPLERPVRVRLCQATSPSRDFRNEVLKALNIEWTYTNLAPSGSPTTYRALPATPPEGYYTAFFIELEYANKSTLMLPTIPVPNLIFTSGVRTLPIVNGKPVYPEFTGYLANEERPDAVEFSASKLPVAVVYGTAYEMGKYYGDVLSEQINDAVPAIIRASEFSEEDLRQLWNTLEDGFLDSRITDEIRGIARSNRVTVTRDMLNLAHASMIAAANSAAIYSTAAYGDIITDRAPRVSSLHSATINDSSGLKLAPHQCAVVYIPDEGVPHTVFTYAGLTFGHTGVNLGGISAVNIPNQMENAELSTGMFVMREALYDALNLRAAVAIAREGLSRGTALVFNDGRNEGRAAYISAVPAIERFDMTSDKLAYQVPGMVYASSQDPLDNLEYQLSSTISNFNSDALFRITTHSSIVNDARNVMNVVYEDEPLVIAVQTAGAKSARYDEPEYFNMQLLFP